MSITAQVEVSMQDVRRLLAELTEVARRVLRFNRKRFVPGQRGAA